ncbi:MAG: biotin--[acetyl-CoA-carboxylase] ligase [Desulfarculales bacterium]|jgi:BirA family biotin operon repressor/biotin-[acetyl-CoA-carboxylase] ligase|nr:biotin--[acetyl-CoA-carboxylase] ligase [Desulfarculales bacterium]
MTKPAGQENDLLSEVESGLEDASLGRPFIFLPETDSTNSRLKQMARQGAGHGACLAADFQREGRGRMNRDWQAPAGQNLLFSLLLRPPASPGQAFHFTALAGLSLCLVLETHGLRPLIKWPNDIFLHGAKLCGILSEIQISPRGLDFLVLGMGINVNQDEFPGLEQAAVSLKMLTRRSWRRGSLLAEILNCLTGLYRQWERDPEQWLPPYRERSWLLGRQVAVRDGDKEYSGRAETVRADGTLLLTADDNGELLSVSHGDVSILAVDGVAK